MSISTTGCQFLCRSVVDLSAVHYCFDVERTQRQECRLWLHKPLSESVKMIENPIKWKGILCLSFTLKRCVMAFIICSVVNNIRGRDSSVDIVTTIPPGQPRNHDSIPSRWKRLACFSRRSDRLLDPPRLLSTCIDALCWQKSDRNVWVGIA